MGMGVAGDLQEARFTLLLVIWAAESRSFSHLGWRAGSRVCVSGNLEGGEYGMRFVESSERFGESGGRGVWCEFRGKWVG